MMDQFEPLIRKFTREVIDAVLGLPVKDLAKLPRAYEEALAAEDRKARPRTIVRSVVTKLAKPSTENPKMHRDPEQCRLANRYGYLLRALSPSDAAQMKKIRINSDVRKAVAFGNKTFEKFGPVPVQKVNPKKAKKSVAVPEYRRIQGRYLGLLRHSSGRLKLRAKSLAQRKGISVAVKFLEQHR